MTRNGFYHIFQNGRFSDAGTALKNKGEGNRLPRRCYSLKEIYEALAISDIQLAAKKLLPSYEKGDDGKMLSTVLDTNVVSSEFLDSSWNVEDLLKKIALSEEPRYHSLIDTGALITGYSNQQVAEALLKFGLPWCDGVVFLDENDKQRVFVRDTGRVVPADQCGVPLDRRFAFYDQIHTTGIDIEQTPDAIAVLSLDAQTRARDCWQGAMRLRKLSGEQKVQFILPEAVAAKKTNGTTDWQVEDVVALAQSNETNRLAEIHLRDLIREEWIIKDK